MLNTSFSPWPCFSEEEADVARSVLLSNRVNYWTGEEGRKFETEFARFVGAEFAVVVANGTVALDLAWLALRIGIGDEVIVSPRSFAASVMSIVNCGATPVFADVDRDSQLINPRTVAHLITPRTRAVLAVHLAGWPCDMDGLAKLCQDKNIQLVEDCAQAHGARYRGRPVGSLGSVAAWSFCQDKIITTGGEGGMITTNNQEIWNKAWSYKDHGKSYDACWYQEHPPGFRWLHDSFGTNWRLPEVQSAIGRIQLRKMPVWHDSRSRNAEKLQRTAREHAVFRVPSIPDDVEHAWYKCYFFVRPENIRAGWTRDRIIAEIVALGVPCYSGACPEIYLEKAFAQTPFRPKCRLPVAMELGETSLMFLVHPTLTEKQIETSCEVIDLVGRRATR